MATLTIAQNTLWSALEGTSTSSVAVGSGSKAFTTQAGKAWLVGMPVMAAAIGTKLLTQLVGVVSSYSGTSLVINVTAYGCNGANVGALNSMWGRFATQAMSQTSNIIAASGSKTFATRPGLNLVNGDPIRVVNRTNIANFMSGTVSTYNNSTGALTITVTASGGSGTLTDWVFISLVTPTNWVISPADSDTVNITSGAILTIDQTPYAFPATLSCTTIGTCLVSNASNTDPVILTLSNRANTGNNGKFIFQNAATFQTRGAPIVIATGTGSEMSYTFPSPAWDKMFHPTYVEVETGNGTNVYERWGIASSQYFGSQRYGYIWGADIAHHPTSLALVNGGGGTGVGTLGTLAAGTGYTNGAYTNVPLTLTSLVGSGTTVTVVVSGGVVSSIAITAAGTGHVVSKTFGNTYLPGLAAGGSLSAGTAPLFNFVTSGTGTVTGAYVAYPGSGLTDGTYTSVAVNTGGYGATADIAVVGAVVAYIRVINPGTGYDASSVLSCAAASVGGTVTAAWTSPISAIGVAVAAYPATGGSGANGTLYVSAVATGGVAAGRITTAGTLYTAGTYTNIPLTGGAGNGVRADIIVAGGAVTRCIIRTPGNTYATTNTLSAPAALIGGTGSGFVFTVDVICSAASGALFSGYNGTPSPYAFNDVLSMNTGYTMPPQVRVVEIGGFAGPTLQTNILNAVTYTLAAVANSLLAYTTYTCTGGTGTGAIYIPTFNGTGTLNSSQGFFVAGTGYSVGDILTVGGLGLQVIVTEVQASGSIGPHNKVCSWDPNGRTLRFGDGVYYGAAVPNGARVRVPNIVIGALVTEAPLIAAMTSADFTMQFESAYAINDFGTTNSCSIDGQRLDYSAKSANTLVGSYTNQTGTSRIYGLPSAHGVGAVCVQQLNGRFNGAQRAQFATSPGGAFDCEWTTFDLGVIAGPSNARLTRLVNCGWTGQIQATGTTGPVTINNCSQANFPYIEAESYTLITAVQNSLVIDGLTLLQSQYASGTASHNLINPVSCPQITAFKNINVILPWAWRGDWRALSPQNCTFVDDDASVMQNINLVGGFAYFNQISNTRVYDLMMAGGPQKIVAFQNTGAWNYLGGAKNMMQFTNCVNMIIHGSGGISGTMPYSNDLVSADSGCAGIIVHDVNMGGSWGGIVLAARFVSNAGLGCNLTNIVVNNGLRTYTAALTNNVQTADVNQNVRHGLPILNQIDVLGNLVGGSGYTNGTYTTVALTGGTGKAAVATVVVAGGVVTSAVVQSNALGFGYSVGDTLTGTVTGGSGWSIQVLAVSPAAASGQGIGHGSLDSLDFCAGYSPLWNTGGGQTPNLPDANWFMNLSDYGPSPTTGRITIGSGGPNSAYSQISITSANSPAVVSIGSLVAGSGYNSGGAGTFYNVALTGGTGSGATAQITLTAGAVTTCTLVLGGSGYTAGDTLSADASSFGTGGSGFNVTVLATQSLSVYTDNGGRFFIGGNGDNATFLNAIPLRGITGFRNITPMVYGMTAVTTGALGQGWCNFKVLNAGSGYTTTGFFYTSGGSGANGVFYQTANTGGAITGGSFMGVGYQVGDVIQITGMPNANGNGLATIQLTSVPTLQFRMCPWGKDITAVSYANLTPANMLAAFAAMVGYDRNVGLAFQLSITSNNGDPARFFNFFELFTTLDPSFSPPVSYVPVGASNAQNGSTLGVVQSGSLTGSASIGPSGTATVLAPYMFDGSTTYATVSVRYLGYFSADTSTGYKTNGSVVRVSQTVDPWATITNPATISAYTTLPTLATLYDAIAYYSTTSQGLLYPVLGSVSGGALSLVPTNLVIDASAGSALSYNNGTSTLTINSSSLGTGSAIRSLSLTGTLTLINGAVATVPVTSAAGTTGVFTLSGLTAGSALALYNDAGVRQTYVASSGTSQVFYIPAGATGTWSYKVRQFGLQAVSGAISVAGGGYLSASVVQLPNLSVTDTLGNVTAYTSLGTPEKVINYAEYWATTLSGIDYAVLATKSGVAIDVGSALFRVDPTASLWTWAPGSSTLTVKASTYVAGTNYTRTQTTSTVLGINGGVIDSEYDDATGSWRFIKVAGQLSNTYLQIYDVTDTAEWDSLTAGTSYSRLFLHTTDKAIRLRAVYVQGLVAKNNIETFGTFGPNGAAFTLTQSTELAYTAVGIDGTLLIGSSEFTADYPSIEVDVNDSDNVSYATRLYAWYRANEATAFGIANFFNGLTSDGSNFTINSALINLKVKNIKAAGLTFYGNLQRSDGLSPFDPAGYTIVQSYAPAVIAKNDRIVTDLATVKAKTDNLPSDPASNTVVNTRMATFAYVAPDNAGISEIKSKTDNLPTDPASNTQVNTRLAASAYVEPDNASIASVKGTIDSNLDASISSRASQSSVNVIVAPDNASISAIKAKTDNLPSDPASNTQVNTRMATFSYTPPDNASISTIKAKTNNLPSDPASDATVRAAPLTAVFENGKTLQDWYRLSSAVFFGVQSGTSPGVQYVSPFTVGKIRIAGTVDADTGVRTAVTTLDAT